LREHEQAFRTKGATLAAIGLGDRNYARMFREDIGIAFPLLIDEGRQAYRAAELKSANLLHILRRDNALARKRAHAAGHYQKKLGQNPFQLGEALSSAREMWIASLTSAKHLATMLRWRHSSRLSVDPFTVFLLLPHLSAQKA
jgi:hypothetical protein